MLLAVAFLPPTAPAEPGTLPREPAGLLVLIGSFVATDAQRCRQLVVLDPPKRPDAVLKPSRPQVGTSLLDRFSRGCDFGSGRLFGPEIARQPQQTARWHTLNMTGTANL